MVSKASELLPLPDKPVMTMSLSRGSVRSTFLRLCSRAPVMTMESVGINRLAYPQPVRPLQTPMGCIRPARLRRAAHPARPARRAALGRHRTEPVVRPDVERDLQMAPQGGRVPDCEDPARTPASTF